MIHRIELSRMIALASIWVVASTTQLARAQSCGDTLGPGDYALTADIGPCDGPGPALTLDSANLYLADFTVSCADVGPIDGEVPVGIRLIGENSRVHFGQVNGCSVGVDVADGTGHTVYQVTAEGNELHGIHVRSTTEKIRIDSNHIGATGGIQIFVQSNKNRIYNNSVELGSSTGIRVDGDRNRIDQNLINDGIDGLYSNGSRNRIFYNYVTACGGDGIVTGGDGRVKGCQVAQCLGDGFRTESGGTDGRVTKNTATANLGDGFEIDGSDRRVTRNTATGNHENGIHLVMPGTTPVTVSGNTATGNAIEVGYFDLADDTVGCNIHEWRANTFGTASDACIE
jgi:hypothetical protein